MIHLHRSLCHLQGMEYFRRHLTSDSEGSVGATSLVQSLSRAEEEWEGKVGEEMGTEQRDTVRPMERER